MPSAVHNLRRSAQLAGAKSRCCYLLFLIAILPCWNFSVSCLSCNLACWYSLTAAFLPWPRFSWSAGEPGWSLRLSLLHAVEKKRRQCRALISPLRSAGPRVHGCCSDAAAPLRVQALAQPERSCCTADCSSLRGYSGGKDGCHQNQAAGTAVCAGWAAPVPAGLPPGSSSHTQHLNALLRDVWDCAVLTREPYVAWEGFL